jgi:hypothetical protein
MVMSSCVKSAVSGRLMFFPLHKDLRECFQNVLTRVLFFFRGLVMSTTSGDDLAGLLRRTQAGVTDAEQQLVALLYQDLRAIAARRMRRERPGHTWQPTWGRETGTSS